MNKLRHHQRIPALLLALIPFSTSVLIAEESHEGDSAEELVTRALQAELQGDAGSRKALLDQALMVDAEYAPARWHSGQIRVDDEWLTLADAADHWRNHPAVKEYHVQRDRFSDGPSAELSLARWCRRQRMTDRGDTHLVRVLYGDQSSRNERATAAKMLKWTIHRGVPVPVEEVARIKQIEREQHESATKWGQRISKLTEQLSRRGEASVTAAIAELRSIQDVHAINALESILSPSSEQGSLLTISILGSMPDHAATQSLVRHAVLSRRSTVANSAIAQLKLRPLHDCMPYLLGALETPIHFATDVQPWANGQIVRNVVMYREGIHQDHKHLGQVISTPVVSVFRQHHDNVRRSFTRDPSQVRQNVQTTTESYDDRELKYQLKLAEERLRSAQLQQRVAAENVRIVQDNACVYQVLESLVDANLPRSAVDWWNWWRDYNEVYQSGYEYGKPTSVTTSQAVDYYTAMVAFRSESTGQSVVTQRSCFTEGTLVWSEIGPVPIQDLRAGDRVLTQNPETGELSLQGIVAHTVRPPTDILRLMVQGDTTPIDCTKGHPFWVNGTGWKMAKEIEAGEWIHTVSGPVEVNSVAPLPVRQPAYNLLVAGNGSYFVGPLGLLVHDNTYRAPTLAVVPGLAGVSR